jgi:hypothetical protein
MTDESLSPKAMDHAEEMARQHDELMAQHRLTPEGLRDEFGANYPVGAVTRLAHVHTNDVLILTILARPFLRGNGVLVKVLHEEAGTSYEIELARAPEGRIGWISKKPSAT